MKTKFALLTGILASVAALAPATSSATLLVGFNSFNGTTGTQSTSDAGSANFAISGFVGTVNKGGQTSFASGGSTDGTYGNFESPDFIAPTGDGYARIADTSQLVFSFRNQTGVAYFLDTFLFDFASQTPSAPAVSYQIDAGPVSIVEMSQLAARPSDAGAAADYHDLFINLLGVQLNHLSTIVFTMTAQPNGRIDNVGLLGISSIPEPGSLMALGGVLGAGLLLRTRRSRRDSSATA